MEALLNITWKGENGDSRDAIDFDATDETIKNWATEMVRSGSVAGIAIDDGVNFHDFVVDRFPANKDRPCRIFVRPKTPF